VALWFGSLLPLWIVSKRELLEVAANIFREFSTFATWLVPLIAIVGVAMAVLLCSGLPNLQAPYGVLLATKLSAFLLLMIFAALNKWRLVPAAEKGFPTSLQGLRSSMAIEFMLIISVLGVTAVMTSFYSPVE
jgi:putative copper resistance protein D